MIDGDAARLKALERENQGLRRAVEELSILNDLATAIGAERRLDDVMRTIVRRSQRAVQAAQGVVMLVDERESDVMQTLVRTMMHTDAHALRPDQSLLGWMQVHMRPLILNDPRGDPRFRGTPWDASVRSVLSVPMMVQARLVGLLTVYNKIGSEGFTDADQRLLSIIAAQSAQVVRNARLAEEREEVLRVFGQHTAPSIVEEIVGRGTNPPSRRQKVCVMFLDVRGFTTFAEQSEPETVVAYLNTLFDFMIEEVNRHHGIIHQLLGDGFLAIFGAPLSHGNDAQHAAEAALAIVERVRRAEAEGAIRPTRVGIGLHVGEVVAGMVGSEIHKEYKVTGDAVNLTARIEQMNKQFDSEVLVSESVYRALDPGRFPAEPLGSADVRGRSEPVRLYRLA